MKTVRNLLDHKGRHVSSISAADTALEAAHRMNDQRIGSLVVIADGKVIGIITERDILTRIVAVERDPSATRVEEIMSHPVACCRLDTTVEECRSVMTVKRIRHLPVVEEGRLMGIITSGDILASEIQEHKTTIEYLNEYLYSSGAPHG